jgi:arylsulfatase A
MGGTWRGAVLNNVWEGSSMDRRKFLKCVGAGVAATSMSCVQLRDKQTPPPNVVFILADDLGWAELGCYGNTFNETPNLDRLATQGMLFTHAYAAAPVCSPYRAALMTGQYPARVGITDYLRPSSEKHLGLDHVTIAEMFKSAGYVTGMTGKWHLSGYTSAKAPVETLPDQHGFDEFMISEKTGIGGGSYFHPYLKVDPSIPKKLPGDTEYLTDRLNVEAVEFIERHKAGPFFLYKSHYAVHTQLDGRPDLVAHFEKKTGAGTGSKAERNNPHLAAQLKVIDDGVGMILKKLDKLGIADRTVVVFTSDNGGETHVTTNAPLRAGKSTLYEGGIREPLIVKWSGTVMPGTECGQPTMNIDFYPTFAEIVRTRVDPAQQIDGVSIVPLLKGGALPRDTFYWHYPLEKRHFLGGRSSGAIRKSDWKLIEFFDDNTFELYNLADDPGEATNLAGSHPQKVRQLHNLLQEWRKDVGCTAGHG